MDYSPYEVIVVDNNSIDGSPDLVQEEFPKARLIQLEKNIGIAGWNEGFKMAKGEFVVVLDDDSYPTANSVGEAIHRMQSDASCGIVAFSVYEFGIKKPIACSLDRHNNITFIGCGALIRRRLFDELGTFESILFLYAHEMEFSMRVINEGYRIVLVPEAKVIHVKSRLHRENTNRSNVDKRKFFYDTRNAIIVLVLHFPLWRVTLRLARIFLGRLFWATREGCVHIVLQAFWSAMFLLPHVFQHRLILREETQKLYLYGGFAGGFFFADDEQGLQRPKWMRSLPILRF